MHFDQQDIADFVASARDAGEASVHSGPGLYAFVLKAGVTLPEIAPTKHRVLYAGMTEDCLETRNHFTHKHSGFSTFRRSLGALLKSELGLVAFPRSAGLSQTNTRNYRFSELGEIALTGWMSKHLSLAQVEVGSDVRLSEKELIAYLEPPLCLTGWPNPQRAKIKMLRSACVDEAKRNRIAS